jgi:glyoxylase-like metal-dependent hydrolase (beta-lactamase superfamily II)
MNPQEQRLDYPLGDRLPAPGSSLEVLNGLRWVRMSLPFALDHINLWLLRDHLDGQDGWTLVDCGIANDPTREAWERVFATELDSLPVLRVIVTHMHPDHIGLAHWITERWGCRLWISATDYNAARVGSLRAGGHGGHSAAAFFASHGLTDPESVERVRQRGNYYASMVPQVPNQFRRLMNDQRLAIGGRDWRCIAGYGHAPEHISLLTLDGDPVLISGDMLLPRISTNVSVFDVEPEANPLPLYLQSLRHLRDLPENTLVLPSHGRPFRGLHERVRQLEDHHAERLEIVRAACASAPRCAADLLNLMFKRPLDLHQTTFAMGEALAHLHALWFDGQLTRQRGEDGIWRFAEA